MSAARSVTTNLLSSPSRAGTLPPGGTHSMSVCLPLGMNARAITNATAITAAPT
jgi:hypothetical protein